MTDTPEYRVANGDDAVGILTVLQEVAPEIPLSLDTPERQKAMQSIVAASPSNGGAANPNPCRAISGSALIRCREPASFRVDVVVFSAVAHKLESDSGIRVGLAVVEAAVMVEHGPGVRVVAHGVVAHGVVGLDVGRLWFAGSSRSRKSRGSR